MGGLGLLTALTGMGKRRYNLRQPWLAIVHGLGVGLVGFEIWSNMTTTIEPWFQGTVFLILVMMGTFLTCTYSQKSDERKPAILEILIVAILAVALVYVILENKRFVERWPWTDPLSWQDMALGIMLIVLTLEMCRRSIGLPLVIVALVFIAYSFLGPLFPGSFWHKGMSFKEFVDTMVFTTNGLIGSPIRAVVTYVFMFVLFGTALELSGGADFFFKLARAISGRSVGGPAKIAVVSSGFYGSISGSPTSNVLTTGAFTIPLMKRLGYPPTFAGAVEATASTGGALLPPVMGSAAFLMVEFAGIPYLEIVLAGALPALLYYLGVYLQVHFRAVKMNLGKMDDATAQRDSVLNVLKDGFHHLIPFAVLMYLLFEGYTPTTMGLYTTAAVVVVSWFRGKENRMGPRRLWGLMVKTSLMTVEVSAASAAAGLVAGGLMLTGLGGKLTSIVFQAAGGELVVILAIVALAVTLLGMGMPAPGAYALGAVFTAPALAAAGVGTLMAHLFIVYYASLSAITPPVAVAAFAASALAQANPNTIGWLAVKLGFVGFILPFMFVYQPALLLRGEWAYVLLSVPTAIIGVVALASAFEGWMLYRASWPQRALLFAGGLLLVYPGLATDLTGLGAVAVASVPQAITWFRTGHARPAVASQSSG
ncbi:MAG: TRAP transporter fused permease subunit [Chloroflexi bacterium]|nr:TRAP transporter fused permease subunit [Chloroflexota bacterium]